MVDSLDPQVVAAVLGDLREDIDPGAWFGFYREVWLHQALATQPELLAEIEGINDSILLGMRFQEAVLRFGPEGNRLEALASIVADMVRADMFFPTMFMQQNLGCRDELLWSLPDMRVDDVFIRSVMADLNTELGQRVLPNFHALRTGTGLGLATSTLPAWHRACDWFAFYVLQRCNVAKLRLIASADQFPITTEARRARLQRGVDMHRAFMSEVGL